MPRIFAIIPTALLTSTLLLATGPTSTETRPFTSDFGIEFSRALVASGGNLYHPLVPGTYSRLAGFEDDEWQELEIIVTDDVIDVNFLHRGHRIAAQARVVEERTWIDGELDEVTEHYYTCCRDTGNVFRLGESADVMPSEDIADRGDRWIVGDAGVQPGLAMPAFMLDGARYYSEFAPDLAMCRVEHLDIGLTRTTPFGSFDDCLLISETDPLEPEEGETLKTYAPGIGLVSDGPLQLVEHY